MKYISECYQKHKLEPKKLDPTQIVKALKKARESLKNHRYELVGRKRQRETTNGNSYFSFFTIMKVFWFVFINLFQFVTEDETEEAGNCKQRRHQ